MVFSAEKKLKKISQKQTELIKELTLATQDGSLIWDMLTPTSPLFRNELGQAARATVAVCRGKMIYLLEFPIELTVSRIPEFVVAIRDEKIKELIRMKSDEPIALELRVSCGLIHPRLSKISDLLIELSDRS